jgi:hypothetical protein
METENENDRQYENDRQSIPSWTTALNTKTSRSGMDLDCHEMRNDKQAMCYQ